MTRKSFRYKIVRMIRRPAAYIAYGGMAKLVRTRDNRRTVDVTLPTEFVFPYCVIEEPIPYSRDTLFRSGCYDVVYLSRKPLKMVRDKFAMYVYREAPW